MKVRIPSPLRSYTGGPANVTVDGDTVADVLEQLDRQYPGLRFRVVDEQGNLRDHMTVWLDGERCRDLAAPVTDLDEVVIMQALSGG